MNLNETHDPSRQSWLRSANHPDTDFPIQNLPLGIFREGGIARGGAAIGDRIFDLAAALDLGFLSGEVANAVRAAAGDTLNPLMALGRGQRPPCARGYTTCYAPDGLCRRPACSPGRRLRRTGNPAFRLIPRRKCARDEPLHEYFFTNYADRRQVAIRIRNHRISPAARH
jgi:hypothetical protein